MRDPYEAMTKGGKRKYRFCTGDKMSQSHAIFLRVLQKVGVFHHFYVNRKKYVRKMAEQVNSEEPMDIGEPKVIEWHFRLYPKTYTKLFNWILNGNGISRGLLQFKADIPELGIKKKDYLLAIDRVNCRTKTVDEISNLLKAKKPKTVNPDKLDLRYVAHKDFNLEEHSKKVFRLAQN